MNPATSGKVSVASPSKGSMEGPWLFSSLHTFCGRCVLVYLKRILKIKDLKKFEKQILRKRLGETCLQICVEVSHLVVLFFCTSIAYRDA